LQIDLLMFNFERLLFHMIRKTALYYGIGSAM